MLYYFRLLSIGSVQNTVCFSGSNFTVVTGGPSGLTEYIVFDQDANYNIVAGATSFDTAVVSAINLPNAFAVFMNTLG